MNIGKQVKQIRKIKGVSQKELASRLGIAPNTLYRYERGDIAISLDMINKIAAALGVTISELYLGYSSVLVPTNNGTLINFKTADRQELLKYFEQLNEKGKEETIQYTQYLTTKEEYTKSDEE